tara:strand:- start:558 stop:731 length:174 start_codon:yes stop_codon:yes gene_type:complete
VKLHNDWIVDLYYKEMVTQKNMEKNHDQHSQPTEQIKKTAERDRTLSRKLRAQETAD